MGSPFLWLNSIVLYMYITSFKKFIYSFIYGCAGSSLLHRPFSRCSKRGLLSSCRVWALVTVAPPAAEHGLWGARASAVTARRLSSCSSQALEHRLSGCGSWALLLRGMSNLPRSGTEPMSPALAGRFFTTESPGKPIQESASSIYWLMDT